jgi:hypothetical protein
MHHTIFIIGSSIILAGCLTTQEVTYKKDLVYQGKFVLANQDTVSFTVFRQYGIVHRTDSSHSQQWQKPSPFSPSIATYFYIPSPQDSVRLEIAQARDSATFCTMYSGTLQNGDYEFLPDLAKIKSGKYFLRQTIGQETRTTQYILLR